MANHFDVSVIFQHDTRTPRVKLVGLTKEALAELPERMIIRLNDIREFRNTEYLSWMDGTQINRYSTFIDRLSLSKLVESYRYQPPIPVEQDEIEEDNDGPGWIYAYTYSPQVQIVGEPTFFLCFQTGTNFDRPMAIKIGRTKRCPLQRIANQINLAKVALPNSPVPILFAWTPGGHKALEKRVQGEFRSEGKRRSGAPGAEWFDVAPSDVIRTIISFVEEARKIYPATQPTVYPQSY